MTEDSHRTAGASYAAAGVDIAAGDRAVELPDGSLGILPDGFAAQFEPMVALAQKHDGRLRYGRIQVALLDALLERLAAQVDDHGHEQPDPAPAPTAETAPETAAAPAPEHHPRHASAPARSPGR